MFVGSGVLDGLRGGEEPAEEAESYNAVEGDPDTLELDCVFHSFGILRLCGVGMARS